jgi:PAS domain-containing protein
MEVLTVRTPDILSLALIQDGPGERAVLAQVGDHDRVWVQPPGDESTIEFFQIPIFSGSQKWGVLQIAFRPTVPVSIWEWLLNNPWMRFLAFVGVAGFLAYFYFMKRTLRQLDPSGIVPTRVKAALDALAQGVVMIDDQEFIVLANEAFSSAVGKSVESLMGANLGSLLWKSSVSSGL